MERPASRNIVDMPRPTARGTPPRRGPSGLLSRISYFLPWDPAINRARSPLAIGRREPFITPREFLLSILVLSLLAAWTLEIAPLLHASQAVRNSATVAATLASMNSGSADAAGRRWLKDLPNTGTGELVIRRHAGPNGKGGWVEVTASQTYYPHTPILSAFMPRVIHLESSVERDMEQ
jgi:hypothetical protein